MRFIIACMVIVGLCLFALPLIPAFNGVQKQRDAIIASAASGVNLDVPPPIEGDAFPATETAMDAEAIANIEPAAGGEIPADDMMVTPSGAFVGGFTNEAPAGLAEPQDMMPEAQ
jgi:hypothetical protein